MVFAAEDLHLGREVAIKILRPDDADQAHWLARFEREARLASALQHPHICTIHELGEHEGRPFIVMELLEGRTIKQMLQDGPLPIPTAIEFAIQHRIARVEAGAQGEHKLARGYMPTTTYSAHFIADPALRRAVADYLKRERAYVDAAGKELADYAPFRKGPATQT